MSDKYSVIGKNVHRVDGTEKVTGTAKYTFDIVLPNMLYGKILRSPYPMLKSSASIPVKLKRWRVSTR